MKSPKYNRIFLTFFFEIKEKIIFSPRFFIKIDVLLIIKMQQIILITYRN